MIKLPFIRNAGFLLLAVSSVSLTSNLALAQNTEPGAVKGWADALKPKGVPGPTLSLAKDKKTDYVLLLPANPPVVEQKAASILSWWLREMTGAEFRTQHEGALTSATKTPVKFISIGRTQLLAKANLPEAKLDLEEEGYAIAAKGSDLFLFGGRTRGAIYAAYALLEEDLGCRWYALPESANRIPRTPVLNFQPVLRHFVPVLDVRDPYYKDAFNAEWSLRNRTNAPQARVPEEAGGYAKHALFVHTYHTLVPYDQYWKEHPEYFAEVNGVRQPSQLDLSNADVLRIVVENVKKHLRENPGSKFISVSPNDGRGYCECAICSALDKAEATAPNSKTASLINFCNKVGEAIEGEFPNVKITTLAYLDTYHPPKTIRPRKNVVIQLCTDSHAWKFPFFFETESQQFQPAIKAWDAIGADIYIWDYITSYPHHMLPWPNMPIVRENIKFYMDNGAKGVMLQGNESLGSENGPMRSWVWAKQLWDPTRDTRALMRDFIFGYYGDAAQPIWDYNMKLWQMWETAHAVPHDLSKPDFSNPLIPSPANPMMPDWPFITTEFLDESNKLFERAEALAKDPETLQRVRVAKLSIIYVKLARALGFYPEFGAFRPGPWARNGDIALQPYYRNLLNEFSMITKKAGVVNISERQDIKMITDNWTKMLEREWMTLPVVPLKSGWKFRTDPENAGTAAGWFAVDTDDAAWSDMEVRVGRLAGWEAQGFPDYKGATWYRQKLALPEDFERRKYLYLFFGAVDAEAEVYINGVKAFEHTKASTGLAAEKIWETPFFFDATALMKNEGENTIAVRAESYGGVRGIWQPVYLISSDEPLDAEQMRSAVIPYGN